ncbi:MAG: DUF460 domain-containing protein [Candidatus Micrarchaeaceae archaeon]
MGVDLGKVSAIACIDLSGRFVSASEQRFANFEWFVKEIKSAGRPSIIATDKARAEETIVRLASVFQSVLFEPREDIRVSKKREIEKKISAKLTVHERDALSGAMVAYNYYTNKLNQAERIAKEFGADVDEVKARIIMRSSISEAIRNINVRRAPRGSRMYL